MIQQNPGGLVSGVTNAEARRLIARVPLDSSLSIVRKDDMNYHKVPIPPGALNDSDSVYATLELKAGEIPHMAIEAGPLDEHIPAFPGYFRPNETYLMTGAKNNVYVSTLVHQLPRHGNGR